MIADPGRLRSELAQTSRLVFDLDGTLYDTRDFERPALASVVEWLRGQSGQPLPGLPQELWRRRETNRHQPGLFDDALAAHGLPVEWGAECARLFHAYEGSELAHAESLRAELAALRASSCRLAVVSNGLAHLQRRKLTALGLIDMFDVCIYCDPRKPQELKPSSWAWTQLHGWRAGLSTKYVGDDAVDAQFAAAGEAPFVQFLFQSSAYED